MWVGSHSSATGRGLQGYTPTQHGHAIVCSVQKALSPCTQAFLRRLDRAGLWRDVVFLDMDALVVAPLAPAFAAAGDAEGPAFDLALTLSDAVDMCAKDSMFPVQRHPCCNAKCHVQRFRVQHHSTSSAASIFCAFSVLKLSPFRRWHAVALRVLHMEAWEQQHAALPSRALRGASVTGSLGRSD